MLEFYSIKRFPFGKENFLTCVGHDVSVAAEQLPHKLEKLVVVLISVVEEFDVLLLDASLDGHGHALLGLVGRRRQLLTIALLQLHLGLELGRQTHETLGGHFLAFLEAIVSRVEEHVGIPPAFLLPVAHFLR